MNKNRSLILFFLLIGFSAVSAEQSEFYKNPETAQPLVISRVADIKTYEYTYYILDKYKNPVYGSDAQPLSARDVDFREKFFTTVADYYRPSRIEVSWDYTYLGKKKNIGKGNAGALPDGKYELHLLETDRRSGVTVNEWVYYIFLDRTAPFIKPSDCELKNKTVYKNKQDGYTALSLKSSAKANSWQVVLDDYTLIYGETFHYGEEKYFPPAVLLQYKDYASLQLDKHRLTVIAKDCAGNISQVSTEFTVEENAPEVNLAQTVMFIKEPEEKKAIHRNAELFCTFADAVFLLKLKYYEKNALSAFLSVICHDEIIYQTEFFELQNMSWNGYDDNGLFRLSTGEEYTFQLEITNDNNEKEMFSTKITSPLILQYEENTQRKKIVAASIYFTGYNAALFSDNEYFIKNAASLRKTAQAILGQLGEKDLLVIEGNANYTSYPNKNLMKKEQAELIALSRTRAEMVKRAFIFYGFPEHKIKIKANGGDNLLVEPNNKDNWKNRRVELFIEEAEE